MAENFPKKQPAKVKDQPKLAEEQIQRIQDFLKQQEQQKEKQQKNNKRWSWWLDQWAVMPLGTGLQTGIVKPYRLI